MTVYLATILSLAAAALAAGGYGGRRRGDCSGRLSLPAAGMLVALGLAWFLVARLARTYADTDGWGADFAEGFAHSGKWLVLLTALLFGHGWICGSRQAPVGTARRIFYYVALLGMMTMVAARTVPVYFLLDAGRRDANGYLRQSEKVEVTCAAVALLNYLERYQGHPPLTERDVSRVCGVTAEGTTTAGLLQAARSYGLTHATARVLSFAELQSARLPVIVSISTLPTVHHASLLVKLDAQHADFLDPAYGHWEVSRERFQQIWYGKTVMLEP